MAFRASTIVTFAGTFLLAASMGWAQIQVSIGASKDNTLYEDPSGSLSNGAGEHFFAGRNNFPGTTRRGLIAFDIADSIPPGASIMSVTLTLVMSRTLSGPENVSLHRALADWGEGASNAAGEEGSGAPSQTGDATWIHRFFPDTTTLWSSPGGEFDPASSATQVVVDSAVYVWGSTLGMINDVQSWLDSPSTNFGWLVRGVEDSTVTTKRFDSRDHLNPDVRPVLTVIYTPLAGVTERGRMPETFVLHQNIPNPFNPTTAIRYDLPHDAHVTLRVYNVLGQRIRTLVDQGESAGVKTVTWDGRDDNGETVGTGMYLYRIEAGGQVQTRKMALLK